MNWLEKIRVRWLAYATAILLLIGAVVLLGIAGHLLLTQYYPPHLAALLMATIFVFLAVLVLVISRLVTTRHHRMTRRRRQNPPDEIETALATAMDPLVSDWIRRNPGRATAIGLLAGVAAGYSEPVRRVLQDLYNRYTETNESEDC